jgi:hypothetical protein
MSLTKLSLAGRGRVWLDNPDSRPGRVWLVTSRPWTGKLLTSFTVYRTSIRSGSILCQNVVPFLFQNCYVIFVAIEMAIVIPHRAFRGPLPKKALPLRPESSPFLKLPQIFCADRKLLQINLTKNYLWKY